MELSGVEWSGVGLARHICDGKKVGSAAVCSWALKFAELCCPAA